MKRYQTVKEFQADNPIIPDELKNEIVDVLKETEKGNVLNGDYGVVIMDKYESMNSALNRFAFLKDLEPEMDSIGVYGNKHYLKRTYVLGDSGNGLSIYSPMI